MASPAPSCNPPPSVVIAGLKHAVSPGHLSAVQLRLSTAFLLLCMMQKQEVCIYGGLG